MDDITRTRRSGGIFKPARGIGEETMHAGPSNEQAEAHEQERGLSSRWGRNKKSHSYAHFKVYKRRWFGLAQLVLLNIVVSWDVGIALFHHSMLSWGKSSG